MELLHKAWDFFAQHESVTGYSLLGLLTVGGEILFSLSAFQCPCGDRSFTYGLVYLLAPALALLFLGYILNGQTWKLFTGIWLNPRKVFPPEKRCHFFYILGKISLQVCIAPVMWMSVALLNGQFYVCAVSGSPASWRRAGLCAHVSGPCLEELPRVACNQTVLTSMSTKMLLTTLPLPAFYHSSV
uniref:Calcium homeostasis modulator family member 6 n=1 Tax=Ornithorhynchus anatinus TaxID=9258 RepID=A0A6I8NLU5_ORNAN